MFIRECLELEQPFLVVLIGLNQVGFLLLHPPGIMGALWEGDLTLGEEGPLGKRKSKEGHILSA